MAKLGTIAGSTTDTLDITYVPEYLYFEIGTTPTELVFTVLGDGVVKNLDGNGVITEANLFQLGVQSNGYLLRIANGLIRNKNVTLKIANADAAALDVYGFSLNNTGKGNAPVGLYYRSSQQKVFAGSGRDITDFAYLGLPNIASGDSIQISYRNGLVEELKDVELDAIIGQMSNELRDGIPNFDQTVKVVNFIPAADQQVYVMDIRRASGFVPNKAA